jgi:hypothetical protein
MVMGLKIQSCNNVACKELGPVGYVSGLQPSIHAHTLQTHGVAMGWYLSGLWPCNALDPQQTQIYHGTGCIHLCHLRLYLLKDVFICEICEIGGRIPCLKKRAYGA